MYKIRYILLGFLLIGGGIPQTITSQTLTFVNSVGEETEFEVQTNDKFLDVLAWIQSYFQESSITSEDSQTFEEIEMTSENSFLNHACYDFIVSQAGVTVRAKKNRDYRAGITKQQKKDIAYIVKTLAYDSLISIGTSKSSLNKAGDRIAMVHPYCFLEYIFSDEELKAGMHAIRDRTGMIRDSFFEGITGSLGEEAARNNLAEFTPDFARKLKIDLNLILPFVEKKDWGGLVNTLIDKIPRKIDPNRYDM